MTMSAPTDAGSVLCHVVMKWPAVAVAFCAVSLTPIPGWTAAQFSAMSFGADQSVECGIHADAVIPIDLNQMDEYVQVGDCLDDYVPLSLAELQQRCEALPADDKLCMQLPRE